MKLLRRARAVLRDFRRPIPDAALPRIAEQVSSGASVSLAAILLLSPGGPGFLTVAAFAGAADPLLSLVAAPLVSVIFVLNNLWARSEHGRRHPNGILVATAVGIAVGCALMGWTSGAAADELIPLIVVLPALVAMFVPWQPIFALCGAALAIACVTAGQWLVHGELRWPAPMVILAAVCIGAASAVAQQLNRKFWLRFETAKERLLAAERMSNLGRMTAGIAHELKTPLAAIQNSLESTRSLLRELEDSIGHEGVTADDLREIADELAETVDRVGSSADRAAGFVRAIRNHGSSGGEPGHRVAFGVSERVASVLSLLSFRLRYSRVAIEVDEVPESAVIVGDPGHFEQVLTNLLTNALDSLEESGRGSVIRLSCEQSGGDIVLAVEDDGPGVSKAVAPRIFEPLFTTRSDGTGLGLSIARDLVQGSFGGRLRLAPSPRGARFEIVCPSEAS